MCGITGAIAFNKNGAPFLKKVQQSCDTLAKRGPDGEGTYHHKNIALGHRRLAIIDTSTNANQPFTDHSGRYTIIYNGEFFNYKEHRQQLLNAGIPLRTQSDTEVLLYLYIIEGPSFLQKINGFFALAIYDKEEEKTFIARDRLGVKPLLVYEDKDKLIFASEMKALMAYDIPKEIDYTSLYTYLQLNYIPAPHSILENVRKLMPGHYLEIQNGKVTDNEWYKIPFEQKNFLRKTTEDSYENQKKQLRELLEQAVERRLVSDVPLGAFLSGGTDSSIVVAIASKMVPDLKTYSMGFKDEKFFDETDDALAVAELNKTNHTVFNISTDDIFAELFNILDYIDEPFADSSALALNVLSKHTSKHVKVVLSGDGADELFAGYNKHRAEWMISKDGILKFIKYGEPLLKSLPKSRHSAMGNAVRKMHRFAKGAKLSRKDRYWRWCGFIDESEAESMIKKKINVQEYHGRKLEILKYVYSKGDINDILFTDVELVLANDMLVKVDMMSMAHGLEVRSPFLDYNIAEFAFTLPESSKINVNLSKRILKDTFNKDLPLSIREKKKKGFEVPLLKWLQTELRPIISNDLLNDDFIKNQKIFDVKEIQKLRLKLLSNNPEEVHAQIWGLVVFQYWWKKYIM